MPRVVLDPNVLVSGLITPRGTSARILLALREGAFELIACPMLIDEVDVVLKREKFRRYVGLDEAAAFVASIRASGTIVEDPDLSGPRVGEDQGDEYLIALARAARADAIVSGDPHLTRLRGRIPVQSPREFIDALSPDHPEDPPRGGQATRTPR